MTIFLLVAGAGREECRTHGAGAGVACAPQQQGPQAADVWKRGRAGDATAGVSAGKAMVVFIVVVVGGGL